MSKYSSNNNMPKSCSKVIGIQFSILSPDEIRKGSVAEITSRDTYINNKPVILYSIFKHYIKMLKMCLF